MGVIWWVWFGLVGVVGGGSLVSMVWLVWFDSIIVPCCGLIVMILCLPTLTTCRLAVRSDERTKLIS